ncbi:MAG: PAS domain S-box protein [Desulfobacterales bacterium]|nr:PAS domain S-box protein [Desulfobacterales bacterium]
MTNQMNPENPSYKDLQTRIDILEKAILKKDKTIVELEKFHKKSTTKLKEDLISSQLQYLDLFENIPFGMIISDREGNIIGYNEQISKIIGYSFKEFNDVKSFNIYENKTELIKLINIAKKNGYISDCHVNLKTKNDKIINALINIHLLNINGNNSFFVTSIKDITNIKRLEQELINKDARCRLLFENVDKGIVICQAVNEGKDFIVLDCNPFFQNMTHIKESLIDKSISEISYHIDNSISKLLTDNKYLLLLNKVYSSGISISSSIQNENHFFECHCYRLPTMEIVIIIDDLTDMKRVQEKLEISIKEKELLIKEVHHRVKNNLQIISSLLDLESMKPNATNVLEVLKDAKSKIYTIALIHSQLYKTKNFDAVNMKEHLFELIRTIKNFYGKGSIVSEIQIEDDIILPITQAVSCSLVINEIITNSFKHAFKQRENGLIEIRMNKYEDMIKVSIKDDGIGMPEEIDILNPKTIGLKLLKNTICFQLQGNLFINRNHGTEIMFEFQIK